MPKAQCFFEQISSGVRALGKPFPRSRVGLPGQSEGSSLVVFARVFHELRPLEADLPEQGYLQRLLGKGDLHVLVARDGQQVVGGITGYELEINLRPANGRKVDAVQGAVHGALSTNALLARAALYMPPRREHVLASLAATLVSRARQTLPAG